MVFCICLFEKILLWGFFFCGNIYVKLLNIFKSGKVYVDDLVFVCGGFVFLYIFWFFLFLLDF